MVQCFLNNKKLDIDFASIAIKYLDAVRGADWNDAQLKYLKLKNVEVLIFNLDEVRPKSKVREEKKMIIRYLETLIGISQNEVSQEDIITLRKRFIVPILGYKLDKYGYRIAGAWLYSLFFTIPLDIILIYYFGHYFYFIPLFSFVAVFYGLRKDIKAKRNYRLW